MTAFATVESVLNSRPLAYTSSDPSDLLPLTPNHFLYGSSSSPLCEDMLAMEETNMAKRWSLTKRLTDLFVNRFQKEVLPYLALRRRVQYEGKRDVQVGDVVVFFHPTSARKWPLAKVSRVFPGLDGRVRTVEVAVPDVVGQHQQYLEKRQKFYIRDVKAIAPLLPADASTPPSHT